PVRCRLPPGFRCLPSPALVGVVASPFANRRSAFQIALEMTTPQGCKAPWRHVRHCDFRGADFDASQFADVPARKTRFWLQRLARSPPNSEVVIAINV